jgi:carbonic anhydrase
MADNIEQIFEANERYASQRHDPHLSASPFRHLVVITCMDCRVDPYAALGLRPGEAHILRNAGGIVTGDTLRSLIVSHHLLRTEEAVIIMHTDCGMLKHRDADIRRRIRENLGRSTRASFGAFGSVEEALGESIARIRDCPSLPQSFKVTGLQFDVADGRVRAFTDPGLM